MSAITIGRLNLQVALPANSGKQRGQRRQTQLNRNAVNLDEPNETSTSREFALLATRFYVVFVCLCEFRFDIDKSRLRDCDLKTRANP